MNRHKKITYIYIALVSMFCNLHAEKSEWEQLEEAFEQANSLVIEGKVEEIKALKDSHQIKRGEYRKYNLLTTALRHDQLEIADLLLSDGDNDYWVGANPSETFQKHSVFIYQSLKRYYPKRWDRFKDKWLVQAIEAGDEKAVLYLLAEGASFKEGGTEALNKAVFWNNLEMAKRLVELGAKSEAKTLQLAYNMKALEILDFLDKAGEYRERVSEFRKQYPRITNAALLGNWQGPGEWGISSAEFRADATGIIIGAVMPVWVVLKETKYGADLFGQNPDTGEIGEKVIGELHVRPPSKTVRSLGDSVALRRGDDVIYFIRPVSQEKIDEAIAKQRLRNAKAPYIKNLRRVGSAGQQYMMEEGVASVSYKELVGASFITPLKSVNGESYQELVVHKDGGELKVVNQAGEEFSFKY
ncbi:hypothetical protein [Cerasicoccus arenae]|uniref:Ankyrin repeat domain-containing protein n=1 Tax=Cerasicoccus arenae TaxID=424488 RepID=A0A8J3DE72_9BACT|nr:hypothetical protein [Cerasicoccus arenae]MBK1856987.1 hypothetical protein [Cerasicoccus arenae]GHB90243.1 hypothetical protein GCM10007047_01110 [Cerasicoccus arenae]